MIAKGKEEERHRLIALCRLCGQSSIELSGSCDESLERRSWAVALPPARKLGAA